MDFKQFYSEINKPILESYEKNIVLIKDISEKLPAAPIEDKYKAYLLKCSELILFFYNHEKKINDNFFKE